MLSSVVILQSEPTLPFCTSLLHYHQTLALVYFHTLTNCSSRNSHRMTIIRIARGVVGSKGSKGEVQAKASAARCGGWVFRRNCESRQARSSDRIGRGGSSFPGAPAAG